MHVYSAPAKIILFGEHAVVYGEPAIAAPFKTLQAQVTATPAPPGSGLSILGAADGLALHVSLANDRPDNALIYAAQLVLRALGKQPPDLTLELRSNIPIGGGFGSGAAVSAALMRALSAALGNLLSGEALNSLVYQVEQLHHGTPSGIDNTVIVYEQPVYFVRGRAPETFKVGAPLHFLVIDSGVSASTRETVSAVRRLYTADQARYGAIISEIGALVRSARQLIETGSQLEALGELMNANHALLRALSVSSTHLDQLCAVARAQGAYGAKLSGGGRGGSLIALIEPDLAPRLSAALRQAGAAQTWLMHLA
ncbi:MAG: mevalonate kinase [Candidatus Thermofonsia Clade 1 bacterium]|jgi:mevalonate kinase|uniref:Mevalonate kinase n=1 Tax=Candidatus Thermofonsia Clade 1 bacterium TaxID=2364210 RepID=A0A2M8PB02_9CHLR|nr:MAG: mevalonate kinase [Candidatus Thermofonsia Clade 1 bacterium]RMF48743.1 MAG: mevalonate kinase [Chloroflexota bacterium]